MSLRIWLTLACVAAPVAAVADAPAATPRANTVQSFKPDGLEPGMTAEQAVAALRSVRAVTNVDLKSNADGSPWILRAKDAQGDVAVFFAPAAKGAKAARIVLSEDLGKRKASAVLAGWTARFGTPSGVFYTDAKASVRAGWGYKPGAQASAVKAGPGPRRLIGAISTANDTVELSLVDDRYPE